jgi:hypothetical protein
MGGRGPGCRAGGVSDAGGQRAGQHQGAGAGQRGLGADHRISCLPVRAGRLCGQGRTALRSGPDGDGVEDLAADGTSRGV